MKYILYGIIVCTVLLQNCANVKPPTGGERDLTAPVLDTTYPANFSTNIKNKQFVFVFNEPIELNSKIIINPYIDNPYKSTIKKNKLTITFENNFSPNTTYTLSFGQSIQDITEKNKTQNIKYIFSTGTYLDSLKLNTTIKYPLTNKPCKECLVSLYKTGDTNTIYKHNPAYFSYTDQQGKTIIENIASDQYKIYALLDKNNNLTYDEGEKIAIHSSILDLDSNITINELQLISKYNVKQKVLKQSSIDNTHKLKFKKGITSFALYDTNFVKEKVLNHWYSDNYNINITFNADTNKIYKLVTTDTIQTLDTLNISFKRSLSKQYININSETSLKPNENIVLSISNSLENIDTTKFLITLDSIYAPINELIYNNETRTIDIPLPEGYKETAAFQLKLDSNAIETHTITNNTLKFKYTLKDITELGSISGKVTCNGNYILELLDKNFKILKTLNNPKEYDFLNLNPDTYLLRVKVDSNNNGIWDGGNLEDNELPEPILFHNQNIKLRKNWEIKDINFSCPSK